LTDGSFFHRLGKERRYPFMKKRFVPLTRKVNAIIIVSLILSLGLMTFFFALELNTTINDSTRGGLEQQGRILHTAIENFMLSGEAPLAISFFKDLRSTDNKLMIQLYNRDGTPAFSGGDTMNQVNSLIPENLQEDRFFRAEHEGKVYAVFFKPLENTPQCFLCHGSDHTVRGVIDIRADITDSVMRQQRSTLISGSVFLFLVAFLAVLLTQYLKAAVIRPVKTIGQVCDNVANGDFNTRTQINRNEELGALGETVNTMVEGLYELCELTKHRSSSTIEMIKEDKEGKKVSVTLLCSDIRGFTSYTEKNPPERVVKYFNSILNFQSEIIASFSGDIDRYAGDEILAMFVGERAELEACKAAIEIQRELTGPNSDLYDGLNVGIGINTGEVIQVMMGPMGPDRRADLTVIGDNVNVASKLCDAAHSGQILIAESTMSKLTDCIDTDGPFRLKAKGKVDYLKIFYLRGIREGVS
jgi:class 3 adenylate cyclase